MGFRMRAVALTALVLLLTGCVPNEPAVTARPPAADPIFASDEEALAAAVEAYERYVDVLNAVYQDSLDADDFAPVVTAGLLETERSAVEKYETQNLRQIGAITFRDATLQQVTHDEVGNASVTAYICTDFSESRVVDANGTVLSRDRAPSQLLEVVTVGEAPGSMHLLVAEVNPWGSSPC